MKVFWSGFPGPCGGANTEAWHTAKMLRGAGVDVTFIPTQGADLTSATSSKPRLEEIGCRIVEAPKRADLPGVAGLKGSVVISMCNSNFIRLAAAYRDLGCRIVWVNCMTFTYSPEIGHYRDYKGGTFDAYVFQSEWQRAKLEPQLTLHGYRPEDGHLIRGAFDVTEFPFKPRPHAKREPFAIGRLARGDADKWSSNWWPLLARVPHGLHARCMAWSPAVEKKCGKPPANTKAVLLKSCEEPVQKFFGNLHAVVQINGGAGENWPRTGLEAMAAGVPVIAQGQWGWREMIEHRRTGLLADPKYEYDEIPWFIAELAYNEDMRMEIAHAARKAVVDDLASPDKIWPKWEAMLKGLGA